MLSSPHHKTDTHNVSRHMLTYFGNFNRKSGIEAPFVLFSTQDLQRGKLTHNRI